MSFYVTDSASEVVVYLTATEKVSISKEIEKRMKAVCRDVDLAVGPTRRFIFENSKNIRCGGLICPGTPVDFRGTLTAARDIIAEFEGPVEVLEEIDLDA